MNLLYRLSMALMGGVVILPLGLIFLLGLSREDWWRLLLPGVAVFAVGRVLYEVPVRKARRLNEEGNRLLEQGHIAAAVEAYRAAHDCYPSEPILHYNLCAALLRLWRFREAEQELERLRSSERISPEFRAVVQRNLALVCALQGQTEQAEQWLDEAALEQKEATREASLFALLVPPALLSAAVLACRGGEWERARWLLEQQELDTLTGTPQALRDTLLAWSHEHTTGERRPVSPLALFGESSAEKFQQSWPQFVSFIMARAQAMAREV